eukprot:337333-Prorocentrum_minimum.AAC.7
MNSEADCFRLSSRRCRSFVPLPSLYPKLYGCVGHELAHQWFGNLVTMEWWSQLWLNEGFATWVGWRAMDELFPDWKVWSQCVEPVCGQRAGDGPGFGLAQEQPPGGGGHRRRCPGETEDAFEQLDTRLREDPENEVILY